MSMNAHDHDHDHHPAEPAATGLDRREFLRVSTAVAAASALASAGCQVPQELTIPLHDMPETLVDGMGRARFFQTVLHGSPVQVRTREGRPILVTPRTGDASGKGLSARHHAALMDLYDPDRARGPVTLRRGSGVTVASSWSAVGTDVVAKLKAAGNKAVLLTGAVDSPALASAIASLTAQTGMRHVTWSPLACDAASDAWSQAFGHARLARPLIGKADLLLGLGAEFLDRPDEGFEREFAARRSPEQPGNGRMSRFIQLEGRLTLTGANSDRRIRVRDSQLAMAGAALAHELIVARKIGPLAADQAVADALAPFAIATVAGRTGMDAEALLGLAGELASAIGRALVLAGGSPSASANGSALELAAVLLNMTLGAFEAGLFDEPAGTTQPTGGAAALSSLVTDMNAGSVQLLIVAGANPVYDAPASLHFGHGMAIVPFIVSLNDRLDETSALADVLAPASHSFECWSDAALPNGVFAVQQPVIQPLFDTRGTLDVLVDWAAAAGDKTALAVVADATALTPEPAAATAQRAPSTSLAWRYLRGQWATRLSLAIGTSTFENTWNDVLRSGAWQGPLVAPLPRTLALPALTLLAPLASAAPAAVELQLYPHLALADGRAGNNGWLHELPDPITRITWGGALSIAPRRFADMGLENGDLVEIDTGSAVLVAPAYRHAGMHDGQVALPLGLGRTACGAIGNGIGPNGFELRILNGNRIVSAGLPVKLRKAEGREPLAVAQGSDVIDRASRPIVPTTTLSAYQQDHAAGTAQQESGPSMWPAHEYPKQRWGMTIDLSKCNGCGKCVVGCQSENNIPIVGRRGMLDGREMSWLRIDRYYDAPQKDGGWTAEVWDGPLEVVEEPQTLFEPMLCQHCENAPCETVCPFVATMHSDEGLNQQIYNRCVGTRYCGNNCPFKVRRFNYFEYSKPQESAFFRWLVPRIERNAELNTREPMQMKNNPEVTVRSRGVMEKCSFCVQRINAARSDAAREGRTKDNLPDGAVVPACMEACPTGAITFGNVNNPESRVATAASSPRAMKLLDALGVKPSISYLTKVRNDQA